MNEEKWIVLLCNLTIILNLALYFDWKYSPIILASGIIANLAFRKKEADPKGKEEGD